MCFDPLLFNTVDVNHQIMWMSMCSKSKNKAILKCYSFMFTTCQAPITCGIHKKKHSACATHFQYDPLNIQYIIILLLCIMYLMFRSFINGLCCYQPFVNFLLMLLLMPLCSDPTTAYVVKYF